ncbi:Crp/Fnr family transcriptional regulator [uncultured Arcticibacterium sp.]|uniref:Crp/Fnr family transcriptional regulator n=1 Tax=uncultured Arcticibacterium sp. TaxID=2173042 RepID=UPI0030F9F85A
MNSLHTILAEKFHFNNEEIIEIIRLFKPINYPKHSFLVQQGEMSENIIYINKGLAREFFTYDEHKNEDNTIQFVKEGDFYFANNSLLEIQKSKCFTQALEPVKALVLNKETLKEYSLKLPFINRLAFLILRETVIRQEKRTDIYMRYRKGIDRYGLFLESFPNLSHRVSDKFIASYLQMNSSTLSRIRRQRV